MRRVARTVVLVVAALVGFAVVNGAYGWLYLMGPSSWIPGPRVADALPFDELSGHSAMPLLAFLGVWAVAALVLGLLARLVRLERLNAALLLALAVGFWAYLETGASIAIVRQIAAEDAFRAAAAVRAVYVPAAVVGLVAALVGSARPSTRPRTPIVLASLTVVAGLLGLLDAIIPERSETLLARLAPGAHPLARSLEAPLALAILYVAPGLARRRHRAWQLAVGLLAGATVLHVLHSDYGAVPTGLLTVALVSRRDAFDASGDPDTKPRALARAGLLLIGIYTYGAAALWADRAAAGQPFSAAVAVRETSRALVGLGLRGTPRDGFDRWVALSILVLGLVAAASLLQVWLAPWRYRVEQEARERRVARSLVHAWGADTLAPFVLRADKSYFFSEDERAFLAYRVVGGVAIVSGDPIGPATAFAPLLDRFIDFARERDWRVAVLGASEGSLELYRRHGLRAVYHGDEAVVDVDSFSLEGRRIRKVRQSVHRLQRAGYTAVALHPRELTPALRAELEEVAKSWRGDEPERGFVMALDALFRLEDEDAVFVVGIGPDGSARGFLHFAVCPAARALSLSSMPRLRETPNGFNEWLVCEAIEWARAHGIPRVSLNFSPFAALLAPEADLSPLQRVEARALRALKWHFQLDNLLLFNRKFFPEWQRRFVVYERRRDLPRVGIAALAAEAYLPFPEAGGAMTPHLLAGLALALGSAAALNWGFFAQHGAASTLPPLSVRHPGRSLVALFSTPKWLVGFVTGLGGWALYVAALRLAPLSLVQAASAGGIGLLGLLVWRSGARLARRELVGVALAACGLVLLGLSLAGTHVGHARASPEAVIAWLAVSLTAASISVGAMPRILGLGAGLGLAAGVLYAGGDVATKAAVAGGAAVVFAAAVLGFHGLAFVCLQLGFQRGGALATAGVASLFTNALPIAAGTTIFHEGVPAGLEGAARIVAFASVVLGAAALARADSSAPTHADDSLHAERRVGIDMQAGAHG